MGIDTMLQQYEDLVEERDKAVEVAKQGVIKEYQLKLNDLRKKMHTEVDNHVRGLS